MKLVITGGGTGGHIYPALEVGRLCAERGSELHYFGSLRGQEARICGNNGIPFQGFPAEPLLSLRTRQGWRSLARLFQASIGAKSALQNLNPNVVFSTGGYSAAPVMRAARSLNIPYVIHEQNTIPGRSNKLFAKGAHAVATTFKASDTHFGAVKVVRTGLPIRQELRSAAATAIAASDGSAHVLVVGGSQGSKFLNEIAPKSAVELTQSATWMHSSGPTHFDAVSAAVLGLHLPSYRVEAFLDMPQLTAAFSAASVALARSGGTMAELAMFGIPSVLVPLPSAASNHQYHNAIEFAEMGAAVIEQESETSPKRIAAALDRWLSSESDRAAAKLALQEWDVPDSTVRIANLIEEAAR